MLLKYGADANIQSIAGDTPLHSASKNGHEAIVSLLLNNGANPNIQGTYGQTPLYLATYYGREAIVPLLLENGANVNIQDEYGKTPLHQASSNGHEAIVSLLLENVANPNIQDNSGNMPLLYAIYNGYYAIVSLILEHGVNNVNIQNKYGNTPLHDASFYGNEDIVLLLLENGADHTITNNDGKTPLQFAKSCNRQNCVAVIQRYTCSILRLEIARLENQLKSMKQRLEEAQNDVEIGPDPEIEMNHRPQLDDRTKEMLTCPISGDLMRDPVILYPSGKTFDRKPLCTWLLRNPEPRCPWTNRPLGRMMPYIENRDTRDTLIYYKGEEAYQRYDDTTFKLG